jgi:hypothetical protein
LVRAIRLNLLDDGIGNQSAQSWLQRLIGKPWDRNFRHSRKMLRLGTTQLVTSTASKAQNQNRKETGEKLHSVSREYRIGEE